MRQIIKSVKSWYYVDEHKHSNEFNNNNLHTYDPYIEENGKLTIDINWWKTLNKSTQKRILGRVAEISQEELDYKNLTIPHPLSLGKLVTAVYYAYIEAFDYHVWFDQSILNGPKDVTIINLPDDLKEDLAKITRRRILGGSNGLNESELEDLHQLQQTIKTKITTHSPLFARLSGTSGKNEEGLYPLNDDMDVLNFITTNRLFLQQEYVINKQTDLILMPWNDQLNERYEFRIFVYQGKLTGISSQKWYHLFQYSDQELDLIIQAMSDLKFLADLPYQTFVGDVYVNLDLEKNTSVSNLIECNPFGAHCGAGSSLFNWMTDYDQLHGKTDFAELRYLSLIVPKSK